MGEQGNFKFPLHNYLLLLDFLLVKATSQCWWSVDHLTALRPDIYREGGRYVSYLRMWNCFCFHEHFFHFSSEWTLNWQENCETDISTQPWEHRNYQIRKLCRPCWFLGTHLIKRKSHISQLSTLYHQITHNIKDNRIGHEILTLKFSFNYV